MLISNTRNYTIKQETLVILFMAVPFFVSNQILKMTNIDAVLAIWRYIDLLIIVALYMHKKKYPPLFFNILLLTFSITIVSAIINQNSIYAAVMKIIAIFTLVLIVEYYYEKNSLNCLNALLIGFELFIYINFIAILLYPNGLNNGEHEKIWLLDNYAAQLKWFLPAICVSFDYSIKTKKKRRLQCLLLIIILSAILSKSATLTATLSLLFFLWNFVKNDKSKISVKMGIVASFAFLIAIVVFRLQNYFSFLIEKILHRSLSFTVRTDIWNSALYMFSNKPILGYGYWVYPPVPNWSVDLYTSLNGVAVASHAHCQFLHFLIQGGVCFLACFVGINLWLSNQLSKNGNNIISRFSSLIIFLILIAGFVETMYDSPLVFIPYVIAYNSIVRRGKINNFL